MRRTWADFSVPGEGDARFQAGAPPVPKGQGAFPWQGRGVSPQARRIQAW